MRRNSKRPNRVVMAVLGVSWLCQDLMACSDKVQCGKMEAPCREIEMSCKCGMGYRSGKVRLLRARWSPYGRRSPAVFLGTKWNCEDQLLENGWMMPSCSIWLKSTLAMRRRSELPCLNCTVIGRGLGYSWELLEDGIKGWCRSNESNGHMPWLFLSQPSYAITCNLLMQLHATLFCNLSLNLHR